MADTDITLSIGLDPKSALDEAKKLKKQLKDELGKKTDAKSVALDVQTKKAIDDVDEILKKIDELNAHPIQLDVETDEFQKAVKELADAQNELKAFESAPGISDQLDAFAEESGKALEQYRADQKLITQAQEAIAKNNDRITRAMAEGDTEKAQIWIEQNQNLDQTIQELNADLEKQKQIMDSVDANPLMQQYEQLDLNIAEAKEKIDQMKKEGKQYQLGPDPKQMEKVNKQLDRAVDKLKLAAIKNQELNKKTVTAPGMSAAIKTLTKQSGGMLGAVLGIAGGVGGGVKTALSTVGKFVKKVLVGIVAITLGVRGLMSIVNKLRSAIREGFQYLEEGDKKFKKQMTELKDSFKELKANLAAAFMPIIQIAIPYIQQLINWLNMLISKLAMFVAAIAGQNAYTRAIKKTGDAAAGASKQLSKFDELNNLTTNGGSDWSTEQLPIDQKVLDFAEKLKAALAEIKQLFKELVAEPFMEGFKEAIGDWQSKINTIKTNLQDIGGHIIDIFSSEDLQVAMKDYVKSFSKFLGALTGLFANIGLNIGMAVTGGIEKFLAEHKTEIQEDLTDMFTIGSDIFDNFSQLAIDLSNIVDVIGESESLQSTISNLLGTVYKLYSAITLVILKLTDLVSGTIADVIHNNVDNIKQSLEKLFPVFEKASEFLETVATTIKNIVLRVMDEVVTPAFEAIKPILSDLLAVIIKIQDKLSPFFEYVFEQLTALWQDYVDPILNDIIDLMRETMGPIFEMISELWHEYAGPFTDFLLECIDILMPVIMAAFDTVIALFKATFIIIGQLIKTVKEMVAFINAIIDGDWKSAWQHAKQFFEELFVNPAIRLWDLLVDHGRNVCDRLKDFARNLVIGLAHLVESLANIVTSGINDVIISAINGLISAANTIPTVNFPTLSPIQNLSFNIPALASGTVIPPSMGEFIAKLGDNNQETEIVSPLSTMKEALKEALQEVGMAGGGDMTINLTVDGRVLAQTVVKQNEIYRRSTGRNLI